MKRVTFFLLILCLGFLTGGCRVPDDAASQISRAIDIMHEAVEDKSTGPVMDLLAEDFRASDNLQRREIRGLMMYYFRRYPSITVVTSNRDIRVQGERAEVTMDALLLGGEGLIPVRARHYAVSMRWQKDGSDWLLARIKWQRQASN